MQATTKTRSANAQDNSKKTLDESTDRATIDPVAGGDFHTSRAGQIMICEGFIPDEEYIKNHAPNILGMIP